MGNWNLSWHHNSLRIGEIWDRQITGAGIKVAVLDTGLAQPRGLGGSSFEYLDARGNAVAPYDPDGHGTCCASIIASQRGGALGIAPEASIVSFRVLQTGNEAEDIETALVYISQSRDDIDVISCSFIISTASDRLKTVVRTLASAGIVVIAAAGDESGQTAEFPDLTPNAITVAAADQHNQPLVSAAVGPWIDVGAPGNDIPALAPGVGRVVLLGQSSAAAAVASGIAALTLSTRPIGSRRRALGIGLEGLFKATATADPTLDPYVLGAGIVNPLALLRAAQAIP